MIRKNSASESPTTVVGAAAPVVTWPAWQRNLVSAVVAVHVAAVFLAPLNFSCGGGSSPLVGPIHSLFKPYIDAMYLDHGYYFFAPDPGPSHLVNYKLEFEDGRRAQEGTFPDLKLQQPRLLYHRYFMLAETLTEAYTPPEPPIKGTAPFDMKDFSIAQKKKIEDLLEKEHAALLVLWKHRRDRYERLQSAIKEHLCQRYGAKSAEITRVEHVQLAPEIAKILDMKLDMPLSYSDLPEGVRTPEVIQP